MAQPDWQSAEELLFAQSQEIIQRFAQEHPNELFSFFDTVDGMFYGVAPAFDTHDHSLRKAQAHERRRARDLNLRFAQEGGWKNVFSSVSGIAFRIKKNTIWVISFKYKSCSVRCAAGVGRIF